MTKAVTSESVFAGRVLEVAIEEHRLPNGRLSRFEIIRHPGGAAVLPVLPDGRVLLIRQFRPAVGDMVYEIPAGRLEPGESAAECAARELDEEAGYAATRLEPLGGCWSTVGFCDEYIHLFLGRDLVATARRPEPDEVIELCPTPLAKALELVRAGAIPDSKTQLALLHYHLRRLEETP